MSANEFINLKRSESLEKILSMESSSFEESLNGPELLQGLKNNSKEVRQFLSHHLPRLCRIAFRDDTEQVTMTAFKILTYGNGNMIPNLVKSPFFGSFAVKVLSRKNVSSQLIGRLSDVTLNIFQTGNQEVLRYCGYVLLLLPHVDNGSVYSLFSFLFNQDEKLKGAQDWLFEIGFDTELAGALEEAMSRNYPSFDDYSFEHEKLISLLRIVTCALKNPRVHDKVLHGPIASVIGSKVRKIPLHANNFFWETLNELHDKSNAKELRKFAHAAHDLLTLSTERIHLYHAEALCFMTKYLKSRPDLIDDEVVKSILGLMMQFETCAPFLLEAKNFIIEVCKVSALSSRITKFVALILINEASHKKRTPFQIFAMAIVEELAVNEATKKLFKKIDGACEFQKQKLEPYIKKRERKYGDDKDMSNKPTQKKSFWDTLYPKAI